VEARAPPDARALSGTRLYTHPACLRHEPGPGHPESPARLAAVLDALEQAAPALERHLAPRASREQLARVHASALLNDILDRPVAGLRQLDADTAMSAGSAEAALRAAGAACAAVQAVLTGACRRAFCAVRPPGHHATASQAMGFCLFNSVAAAAAEALAVHGLERVAIVDFDVHHGNGTQDIFAAEPRVQYLSSHQWPLYPGTGARSEQGVGNIHNLPLPAGCGPDAFRHAWETELLPALRAFRPQLLLVSAGFDAHRLDPLAGLQLDAADFGWLTRELVAIAEAHAGGRVVSLLEGGYSLEALRACALEHAEALA
jgi:acetoin utilization deacetylase AcuC-like enzyme